MVDWSAWNTVVSAMVGAATVWVGVVAWRTSKRAAAISLQAAAIADKATEIARQQHAEAVSLRENNARILGCLLVSEVTVFPARVHRIARAWKAAIQWEGDLQIVNRTAFLFALSEASRNLLPTVDQVQERLHNMEAPLGPDLATLLGSVKELNVVAADINERVDHEHVTNGERRVPLYAGEFSDFSYLRLSLELMIGAASSTANDLRIFTGEERADYEGEGASRSPWAN